MMGVLVVRMREKGPYDEIWADNCGLKRRPSRVTMETVIELKI